MSFTIKDSGERQSFSGGMVRDTVEGKIDYLSCRFGPMFKRWNAHLTKGREKYPDVEIGVPNWTLAEGKEELNRARQSAARHFEAYLAGETDEDHAAGVFFNINLAEYVKGRMAIAGVFKEQTGADPEVFTEETQAQYIVGYRSEVEPPPTTSDHISDPQDKLRLREYRDRMARERAMLLLPIDAQTAP